MATKVAPQKEIMETEFERNAYVVEIYPEDRNTGKLYVRDKYGNLVRVLHNKCFELASAFYYLRQKDLSNIDAAHELAALLIIKTQRVHDYVLDTFHTARGKGDQQVVREVCDILQSRIAFYVGVYSSKKRIMLCTPEPQVIYGDPRYNNIISILNIGGSHFEAIKLIRPQNRQFQNQNRQTSRHDDMNDDVMLSFTDDDVVQQMELLAMFEKDKKKREKCFEQKRIDDYDDYDDLVQQMELLAIIEKDQNMKRRILEQKKIEDDKCRKQEEMLKKQILEQKRIEDFRRREQDEILRKQILEQKRIEDLRRREQEEMNRFLLEQRRKNDEDKKKRDLEIKRQQSRVEQARQLLNKEEQILEEIKRVSIEEEKKRVEAMKVEENDYILALRFAQQNKTGDVDIIDEQNLVLDRYRLLSKFRHDKS